MNNTLNRIQIIGLHGNKKIDVVMNDNTLILVGENGSGKTTFLRILFHFLSGRWLSLIQFPFQYMICTIAGNEYRVTREELVKASRMSDHRLFVDIPPPYRHKITALYEAGDLDQVSLELKRIANRHGTHFESVLRRFEFFEDKPRGFKKELQDAIHKIQSSISAQILYLPT